MEITEYLAQFHGITAKIAQMGKVKPNFLNKKNYEAALERWKTLSGEELTRLDQEIGSAEVIYKSFVYTPTALCYNTVGVLNVIPVKDILWIYPRVFTQRMNFIPYNKMHQILVLERSGEYHVIQVASTGGFSKKDPAGDIIQKMAQTIKPVRPGIVFGYSKEIEAYFSGDLQQAAAEIDRRSYGQA